MQWIRTGSNLADINWFRTRDHIFFTGINNFKGKEIKFLDKSGFIKWRQGCTMD